MRLILTICVCAGICAAQDTSQRERAGARAAAVLRSADGKTMGTATFQQTGRGVRMILDVSGLTPGEHGLHIHETGDCTPPDFKSAGGHFNPAGKEHGAKNPKGPHAGDLYNLAVTADGTAKVTRVIPDVTLASGDNSLLKQGGTAVVIHAKADDYRTNPAGDAGDRVACGVITAGPHAGSKPEK